MSDGTIDLPSDNKFDHECENYEVETFGRSWRVGAGTSKGKNENEVKEEIGGIYVVLTILSMQLGLDINDCVNYEYHKIVNRKGKMIDGVFVKESDLK